jgi:hypothetical protein
VFGELAPSFLPPIFIAKKPFAVEVEAEGFPKTNSFFFVAVQQIFSPSQRAVRPSDSPSYILRATEGTYFGVKRQELEAGSPFKSEWSKTSTLMEWCLIKHSDEPILFL